MPPPMTAILLGDAIQLGGMNTYCFSRSVSCWPTYLPISLSNCVQFFQGRYSANSADMREPTPGIREHLEYVEHVFCSSDPSTHTPGRATPIAASSRGRAGGAPWHAGLSPPVPTWSSTDRDRAGIRPNH